MRRAARGDEPRPPLAEGVPGRDVGMRPAPLLRCRRTSLQATNNLVSSSRSHPQTEQQAQATRCLIIHSFTLPVCTLFLVLQIIFYVEYVCFFFQFVGIVALQGNTLFTHTYVLWPLYLCFIVFSWHN